MGDMVEHVARALMDVRYENGPLKGWSVLSSDPDFDDLPYTLEDGSDAEVSQAEVMALARAAIEAMSRPTEKMLDVLPSFTSELGRRSWAAVWGKMIDEALGGKYCGGREE